MEIRWLTPEETRAEGFEPQLVHFLVAEEAGRVVGKIAVHLFPRIDEFWVDPGFRDGSVSRALADFVGAYMRENRAPALVIATNPRIAQLAKRNGMSLVPSPVYLYSGKEAS